MHEGTSGDLETIITSEAAEYEYIPGEASEVASHSALALVSLDVHSLGVVGSGGGGHRVGRSGGNRSTTLGGSVVRNASVSHSIGLWDGGMKQGNRRETRKSERGSSSPGRLLREVLQGGNDAGEPTNSNCI